MMRSKLIPGAVALAATLALVGGAAHGAVTLPAVFGDGMVLQRETEAPI